MEHTESRPQDRCSASVEPPSKAGPRLEVLFPYGEVTVLQNRQRRVRNVQQIGHLSIYFRRICEGFVSQAQIEGEARGQFDVVLHIHPEQGFPETAVSVRRVRRWRVKTNGGVGKKAGNIKKCVVAPGVAGSQLVVLNSLDIHAYLDGMFSPDIREIITSLKQVIAIDPGCAVIHAYEIQRVLGQPLRSKGDRPQGLAWDKGQFLRRRVGDNIVEVLEGSIVAGTERIDQGGPQYGAHLNRGILSAGLIQLIGNGSAVHVWDHVRIFIEAVSDEDSRFLADLMVYPGHKIIFVGNLEGRCNPKSRTVSEVQLARLVGSLVEVQVGLDGRAHRYRAGACIRQTVDGRGRAFHDTRR